MTASDQRSKMLAGVRVLDLSRVLAGPYCGQLLGDLGADVIKIERPIKGDDSRTLGPPFLKDSEGQNLAETPIFLASNRNKRSISVDLSNPAGRGIIRKLAAVSDVVIENYKVGDLARHGLDYKGLQAVNPQIIYCSMTGFGQDGPYKDLPGYDAIFQAMSGLMSITGFPESAGGEPVRVGVSIGDVIGGLHGAIAILGALYHRKESGKGQYIDLPLLDTTIASVSHLAENYLISGIVPRARGNEGAGGLPSGTFHCLDGRITITAGNDAQYERLCRKLRREDLLTDPRFVTNTLRLTHRDEVMTAWAKVFESWKIQDLVQLLRGIKIPCGPVNDMKQLFEDEHVLHRNLLREVPHKRAGVVKLVANPVRYSETPVLSYSAPPALGEHTDEILQSVLNMDNAAIDALRKGGAI